jgi:RNA polymerase sigma-70 factor (ECF subfamily)
VSPSQSDSLLIERIRAGESEAWAELIARFEGRLLGYVIRRAPSRAAAEDVVQETFIGLLTSLPNYDSRQPLEGYLFSIAAHKLTDLLRREGRRPTLPLVSDSASGGWEPAGAARPASSLARSRERRQIEDSALAIALGRQIEHWRSRGQWDRLQAAELLLVRGWSNKQVAVRLGLSEQTVANYKFEMIAKLRGAVGQHLPLVAAQGGKAQREDTETRGHGDAENGVVRPSLRVSASPPLRVPATPADRSPPTAHRPQPTAAGPADLEAYLDEALPAEEMAQIEKALRGDPELVRRLAEIHARRDSGVLSPGEVWRRHRLSCASREQLGSFLLGVLPEESARYLTFHLEVVGCRYCQANLADLRSQHAEAPQASQERRRKYFQSSAGYLKKGLGIRDP